jgi:hypothetical protein
MDITYLHMAEQKGSKAKLRKRQWENGIHLGVTKPAMD